MAKSGSACFMTAWSSSASFEEKTKGGIIIPDTAMEAAGRRSRRRRFGARDEAGKLVPLDVGGDRVCFGKWSGAK